MIFYFPLVTYQQVSEKRFPPPLKNKQTEERESQDMAAITRKSGANSSTRASKERKIRKGEDKETMQKMMAELLDKTNNIQGRIAQLESTSSSVPQGTPVSTTIGSHRNRNTPTVTSFSNPHPADEDILRLVRYDIYLVI